MAAPFPFVQAGHDGPGTHFGNGNLPDGCTTASDRVTDPATGLLVDRFLDGCYHMRTDLNNLDTPIIDVLIVPPASMYPERDVRVMRQAIEMWDAGIEHLARDMGMDWLADGVEFNILVDDDHFTTDPAWDPEIVVVATNPVGGAGIGIDPFGLRGPCKGANPMASMDVWEAIPGFDSHHDGHSGTYQEDCEGGGTTCYAINGAIDPLPETPFFGMFDLVAHEVGHCLSVGHVGDASDHKAMTVPFPDIMSYTPQSHTKCVSTLDVEGFALRMSHFLLPAPLAANHGVFQVQHPSDNSYASPTGDARDCPQPDAGLLPGETVDFDPGPDGPDAEPAVSIDSPGDGAEVPAEVVTFSGSVDREGSAALTATLTGPDAATTGEPTRYTLTASGGQSADGHSCAVAATGPATVAAVDGSGCVVDVTWSGSGDHAVTGQVDDGQSTASDEAAVRVTDPDGIPTPDGDIRGGITIFPNGAPLAYNEVGSLATTEAGDPAPKFLPGDSVELNTRFTKDATGVAGPATAGVPTTVGLPFTWHVWSSDGTPVDTVPCATTQDGDATGAPDGFNCKGTYTMPEELGRYYTTLRFEVDGRWSCHNGAPLFGAVASDVPTCLKAFDVVARDDAVPDAPASASMARPTEVLGAGVVPGVVGHVGDVTVSDADGVLRVAMEMEGLLDAFVPGPLGNPFVYKVTFTTDHNGVGQEYALQYTFETDPMVGAYDRFGLYMHSDPNEAGLSSVCEVEADLSASHFDTDTFEAVWVVPLAGFDHDTRTPYGDCSLATVRDGRGLEAGDVLTGIAGTATAKVGVVQFTDLQDTTPVPDYTIQGDGTPAPVVTSVSPAAGPVAGGTPVTVSGANFEAGATVSFGGVAATDVQVVSAQQLTATTPAHAAGAVGVTVTNPSGDSATLASGFTFEGEAVGEHVLLSVADRFVRVDVDTSGTPRATFEGGLDFAGLSGVQTVTAEWFDADGALLATDSVSVRVAEPVRAVDVTAPADAQQARGTTRTYTFQLANAGDAEDTFDLALADDRGWATLVGAADITVPAGATASVTVRVSVPLGGPPGTTDLVELTATSRADGGVVDGASFTVTATHPGPGRAGA